MTDEISDSMFIAIMVGFAGMLLSMSVTVLAYMNIVKDDVVYNFESAMDSTYLEEFNNETLDQVIPAPEFYKLLVEHNDLIRGFVTISPEYNTRYNAYIPTLLMFGIDWYTKMGRNREEGWEATALTNFLENPEEFYYARLVPYEGGYVICYYRQDFYDTDILDTYYHCDLFGIHDSDLDYIMNSLFNHYKDLDRVLGT